MDALTTTSPSGNGNSNGNSNGNGNKKSNIDAKEFEIERVRNRFISHEVKKMDRNQSRINAPSVSSDTESESDSEFFLNNPPATTGIHHSHHHPTQRVNLQPGVKLNNTKQQQQQQQQRQQIQKQQQLQQQQPLNTASVVSTSPTEKQPVASSTGVSLSSSAPAPAATAALGTTASLPRDVGLFALRPSILSSESTGASYRGFLNLMVLLLILTSFRLVILNHLTYGIRIDLGLLAISEWHRWPGAMIGLSLNFFIIMAYLIEKAASQNLLPHSMFYSLRILNCSGMVIIPSTSIVLFSPNPASGIFVMILVCTFSMKIISYAYENNKQRHMHPDTKKFVLNGDTSVYPNNLSLSNTYWYMLIPTLVYQLSYPRSPRIRKMFLLRRIVEALFLSALIFWMVEQYMVPLVENSVLPMEQYDFVRIIERIMKLSLPNLYVWLLGFYVFFHLYLNICAELTRFGDREFYRDWWNSTGLDYFWRTWNMPVHHWMVVMIYTPMRRRGYSKNAGYFMCFFVSAIFHELVISVPFHTIKLWAFFGIMSQMVLIALTKNLLNGMNLGNVIFWFSIVLGQPMVVLLYYRNFIIEHPYLYPKNIIHDNS
ncbi:diacylglycerol O-acyltransferase 1 [Heterostelium album PN500]|uniref:O-acyltransferase n=1 Tax=Heterostelium pallidum (strain ATCC 26659 / Pp 5 / PN500) TaxID=670386 RepID=D3B130_HETP5|nr:diacylglycerol O-acyltransferase 1 [Heterostelium album PN500]EFA85004.1 diacylglycerol O-acyltransferase 1 [Heterostelium album PN500]|eukprot:XP_020437114.1 diacylglycerol O-acyltransferase 1 [Heterostelium album PN500]